MSPTSATFALVMNNETDLSYIQHFPRQWLLRWLLQLRRLRGLLTFLHTMAGLNARYTNIDPVPEPHKYDLEKFLRMLSGMCDYMDEEDFVQFGAERLREFYRFNMKHGKAFREQFKRNT